MPMKPMRKINVGIVGLGWPGARHAEAIRAGNAGELYAAADLNQERREKFQQTFQPTRIFEDYDAMLADPEVEAVVVSLPNFLHFPATLKALEAGKHVLCEKPPTMNSAEMKVIFEEAEKRGLIYFFGRQSRFSPAMLAGRKLVDAGRLGDPYFGRAVWVRSRGTPRGIDGWFTDKSKSGGGALIDIGVHAIDAIWYLMGTPKPVSVTGQVFRNFPQLSPAKVFDVEDAAYGMIRFENGAVVQFETSWAANLTDDVPESGWTGREMIDSTLYGPKATLRLNPLSLFEDQNGALVKVQLEPGENVNAFALQMQNFLESIAGSASPVNNAQQAVYLMEMLDAIYLSSKTQREIPLD
jgi:predicted dehydrogenase